MSTRKTGNFLRNTILLGAGLLCALGSVAQAKRVTLDVGLDKPLLLGDRTQTAHIRVGLRGFTLVDRERSPLNVAIVLDRSGSMQGQKIEKAKEAAIMAVRRLDARDIVSVVTYASTVGVLVPATRASDQQTIIQAIRRIQADGNTALFAGVSMGAAEVRKFLDDEHVNRVILVSDGLANVGPSSPRDLGSLGAMLADEGITVTTIGLGLGFNEDLMTQLAMKSDGSHYFAEGLPDLANAFDREFGRALSVVAQGIRIEIRCAPGVRPIRFLSRDDEIDGQTALLSLNNLFSDGERRAILEVEISAEAARRQDLQVATVDVVYENLATHERDRLQSVLTARLTDSEQAAREQIDEDVMVEVVKLQAVRQNMLATALRDEGKIREAFELLIRNQAFLDSNAVALESAELKEYSLQQGVDADNLEEGEWDRQRKAMREDQAKSLY